MKDIAVTAALIVAASLGCVPFVLMFTDGRRVSAWEQVTTTVGVVAFLTAAGQVLARGRLAAAVLLVLLTWLVHDTVGRHALSRRAFAVCAWVSLALLLSSVGFERG